MNGPWMTQCPPAEGAKKLMTNEHRGTLDYIAHGLSELRDVGRNPYFAPEMMCYKFLVDTKSITNLKR
jgi:hypothetical protein